MLSRETVLTSLTRKLIFHSTPLSLRSLTSRRPVFSLQDPISLQNIHHQCRASSSSVVSFLKHSNHPHQSLRSMSISSVPGPFAGEVVVSNWTEHKGAQAQISVVSTDVAQNYETAIASSSKHTLDMPPLTNNNNGGQAIGKHERGDTEADDLRRNDSQARLAKRMKLSHKLNYRKGLFLAPMVRCGTLPTRLLSLYYGASLVWGPEIVDKAIIGCQRTVDSASGTISFIHPKSGRSIFECHPIEKSRLIFQVGSASSELAVAAAKLVQDDVSGVDLNCGCPKDFSLKGGMGAALLSEPDRLCSILRELVNNVDVPVSAKIRLLPERETTLDLVRKICATGISNLTVHCRTQHMRPREPALLDRLREVVNEATKLGIPVVANGDCWGEKDRDAICELTGVTSIMIARGAEANPSCFSAVSREPPGLLDPLDTIIPLYTRVAMSVNNHFSNSKYCIYSMDLAATSKPSQSGVREKRKRIKIEMSHLKDYAGLCKLLEIDYKTAAEEKDLGRILPGLMEKLMAENGQIVEELRTNTMGIQAGVAT